MNSIEKPQNIYLTGTGDELINSSNYPPAIIKYLNEENRLITNLLDKYDMLIELGCMTGLHSELAVLYNKYYIGVDVIERYINMARRMKENKDNDKIIFECLDILNLGQLFSESKYVSFLSDKKSLMIFPFNSFGNLADPEKVLGVLKQIKKDVLICTYKLDDDAEKVRSEYYKKSGFDDVELFKERNFSLFKSKKGLNSWSFNEDWFLEKGFNQVDSISIDKIGCGIYIKF